MKVLVGGCFNKIHPGHLFFLKRAKELGDELVVVVTNDKNNKKYGISQEKRKKMVEELGIASRVVIGRTDDMTKIVLEEKPKLIVLGYDQKLPKGVEDIFPGKIVRIEKHGNYSSRE